jgi:hypothetical protein
MMQKLMYRIGKTNEEEDFRLDFLDGVIAATATDYPVHEQP